MTFLHWPVFHAAFSIAGRQQENALGRPTDLNAQHRALCFLMLPVLSREAAESFSFGKRKDLLSHDQGNTSALSLRTLREELKYQVTSKLLNVAHFVHSTGRGFLSSDLRKKHYSVRRSESCPHSGYCLEAFASWGWFRRSRRTLHDRIEGEGTFQICAEDKLWAYLQAYAEKHRNSGKRFRFRSGRQEFCRSAHFGAYTRMAPRFL